MNTSYSVTSPLLRVNPQEPLPHHLVLEAQGPIQPAKSCSRQHKRQRDVRSADQKQRTCVKRQRKINTNWGYVSRAYKEQEATRGSWPYCTTRIKKLLGTRSY